MPKTTAPTVEVYAGDRWGKVLAFTEKVTPDADPTPVDLVAAGWNTWRAQWRTDPSTDDAAAINLTVIDTDAATGIIRIQLTGAQTESMGASGGYDLQALDADGEPFTWYIQRFTWTQDYTR